jgi:hypothetical protein
MFKNKLLIISLVLVGLLSSCTQSNYKSTKTSLELQAMQKKEFNTPYKTAFASVLSVFQDKGYTIDSANADTGIISAAGNKKSSGGIIFSSKVNYMKASAFIEQMPSSRVAIRLNFVNHQETSSGYGMKGGNSVPIEKPEFYQEVFEKIQKAIFVRSSS